MLANEIALDRIEVSAGRRAIDPDVVNRLAKSIAVVGLQHPIAVRRRDGAFVLVAGAHRLAAFRKLEMERIPANVVDLNTLEAELLEIDENLARNELSPAERTAAIARRKMVYEEVYTQHVDTAKKAKAIASMAMSIVGMFRSNDGRQKRLYRDKLPPFG
jgi:ParB family transcriptional regulator, chromosome partitioning protein